MDQHGQNTVLINNSGTEVSINCYFKFLGQLTKDPLFFSKDVDNFQIEHKHANFWPGFSPLVCLLSLF